MLTSLLLASALVALAVSGLEVFALLRHLGRGPLRAGASTPLVSVLKPLCGRDTSLEENLQSFIGQRDVPYELLLGVRDADDAAYPVACALAAAHPDQVRVVLQQGEVGANPKVNQLVTLAAHARGSVFVISDSNVRVPAHYLSDLVAPLEDPGVGMVTSPIAGHGGKRLGGQVDALHLNTFVTPGVLGTKLVARQDLFIGKSMAFRRPDLQRVGGFRPFARVLAEDHALGRAMLGLGLRAELARVPIANVTDATLSQAFSRYARWGLMQRFIAGPGYPAQLLTFPMLLAVLTALTALHQPEVVVLAALVAVTKLGLDGLAVHALTGRVDVLQLLKLAPIKELVVVAAFFKALSSNVVAWRGQTFHVARGTRLIRPEVLARFRAMHATRG
jgi:ceramide glucosyltransferase